MANVARVITTLTSPFPRVLVVITSLERGEGVLGARSSEG
jgi:hypothetical protein